MLKLFLLVMSFRFSRTIPEPKSLDVIGAGVVNVTFRMHKEYSSPTGVDIAWIKIDDPRFINQVVDVAELSSLVCIQIHFK